MTEYELKSGHENIGDCGHSDRCGGSCIICCCFVCKKCGLFEGGLTTHCPGVNSYSEYADRVYEGSIDYRDGSWRLGETSESSPAYHRKKVE